MYRKKTASQRLLFYYGLVGLLLWSGVASSTEAGTVQANTIVKNKLACYQPVVAENLLAASLTASNKCRPAIDGEQEPTNKPEQANKPETAAATKDLIVGQAIMRELQGEQTHRYRLTLAADQYLDLVADQQGIDVVLRLYGPDGKLVAEIDSPNGDNGPEPLSYISSVAGAYQIEISSLEKDAPLGRYTLKLNVLRSPTNVDRQQTQITQLERETNDLTSKNRFQEAIVTLEKAIELQRQLTSDETPALAEKIDQLSFLYYQISNLNQSEKLILQAREIWLKVLGAEHLVIANSYTHLAAVYREKGEYQRSVQEYQKALQLREKLLGPEHAEVARSINSLGALSDDQGDYEQANKLYRKALAIQEKVFGRENLEVAITLNNLGSAYHKQGDYQESEKLLKESLQIVKKLVGPDHPENATVLNNLASLYQDIGDYSAAEPLLQRTLAISEKALGPEHPKVALAINNLAVFYGSKGDYQRAETLYRKSLAIYEKGLGPEHPSVAGNLNNLGRILEIRGDYRSAISLHQRALAIQEKFFGPKHPSVAFSLHSLSLSYRKLGDAQQAINFSERALATYEQTLGQENQPVAFVLSNLAEIYNNQREYQRASEALMRVRAICEKIFGIPAHPLVAENLNSLAEVALRQGQIANAIDFQARSLESREGELLKNLLAGSEKQKLIYLKSSGSEQDFSISLHLQSANQDIATAKLALTTILRRKGRALDVMTDSIDRLRQQATPADQQLLDELRTLRAELAVLALRGAGKQGLSAHRAQLTALEEKIETLESQISARSAEFRTQRTPVTLAAVQQAIPAQAVLLEFITYRPYDVATRKFKATHYAVYALTNQGELGWADLGEASTLEPIINQLREQLRRKPRGTGGSQLAVKTTSKQLRQLLLAPLQALIADKEQLLISPDGALNFVPFDVLVDDKGRYLVERYAISYLTSGRDLLRLQNSGQPDEVASPLNNTLVVANPRYGNGSGPILGGRQATPLKQLPGAGQEAQLIYRRLPQTTIYTAEQATERLLKEVKSPQILHIATHGYFLDKVSPVEASAQNRALEYTPTAEDLAALRSDNPLLRSWLFFAGANNAQTSNQTDAPIDLIRNIDDGILTALEASNLNLKGTKLVVLSACQTGLGEVESGEGVYGLRRALVLAGAESQLTSLWAIDDRATRDLMSRYYELLQQGTGRHAALRQVQLEFLHKKLTTTSKTRKNHNLRSHPYYWAGFILSGEWSNLAGKR